MSAHPQGPATGYAPVHGLKMYYEIHACGGGEPLAVEMQGHGPTADIARDFSYESLADDIAAGDQIFGDMRTRSDSRLAVLPNTTHVTLMEKAHAIIPMVNDFLDSPSGR